MARSAPEDPTDPGPAEEQHLLHTVTSGTGPLLVLIHGVAGSSKVWDNLVPNLGSRWTVLRVDLLGYGHSPKPRGDYTPDRHVAAIRRTLCHLGAQPPFTLIGLSMGANLVLDYAWRFPDEVQNLIAIGFPYYPSEAAARLGLRHNQWTRLALQHALIARAAIPPLWWVGRHTTRLFSRRSSVYNAAMAKDALLVRYQSFRSSLLHCMVDCRLDEPLAGSGELPRLFIHGGSDQWATAASVGRAIEPFAASALRVLDVVLTTWSSPVPTRPPP